MNSKYGSSILFPFFLLICVSVLTTVPLNAQQSVLTVRNQPLSGVLDSLEKIKGISFSYDYDVVREILVDTDITIGDPARKICENLFANLPLEFEIIDDKHIRLIPVQEKRVPLELAVRIIDAQTGEPVPYVAVAFNIYSGTETDTAGMFYLPENATGEISLHHIGYQRIDIPVSDARMKKVIRMVPVQKDLEDIIVLEDEPGIQTLDESGATVLHASRIAQQNSSVFTADPMRTIQLLPGIGAQNDLSSDVRIRGGDADESLIVLDGMTLYEAKHYYGIFSTINAGVVDEIAVYKNNTPVYMEGRTSGVVDISTHSGAEKEQSFLDVQAGLMNASASTYFSLANQVYIMAGGRFTTGNPGQSRFQRLLNPRPAERILERDFSTFNVVSQVPNYAFQDWNGKLVWTPGEKVTFYATTFHSHDETALDFDRTLNINVQNMEVPLFREEYDEQGEWNNHAYQAGVDLRMGERISWENRVVYSETNTQSMLESTFWRRVNKDSTYTGEYSNMISNDISDLHAFSTLKVENEKKELLTAGMDYQRIDNVFLIEYGDLKQFDQAQESQLISAYVSWKWRPWKSTAFDLGMRGSHYNRTDKIYLSPQVLVTHNLSEGQILKASYSSPAQFMQRAYYEDLTGRAYTFWINANDIQVPVSRANKWMAGYHAIYQRFKWDAEVFYKRTGGIIEIASNQIGFDPQTSGINTNTQLRVFQGNSRSFGLDLLGILEVGNLTSQLSYTWSKTDQQFQAILNNTWIPSRDDSRHQLKFAHTYRLKNWTFQTLWVFSSGRPYTDISKLTGSIRNRLETDPSAFQTRLKDYHRVDIGVSYTFDLPAFDLYVNAGVLNVFNRRNVKYAQYIFGVKGTGGQGTNTVAGTEWGLLDRTFNLSAGIRF